MNQNFPNTSMNLIITAGSTYLDIDAYACCVAMAELLQLQGQKAIAYSTAPCNYSVCKSLTTEAPVEKNIPVDIDAENTGYIIVDVSDPEFLKKSVPLEKVVAVYDHHVGFEEYWQSRIGEQARIEFIGAAATLIFRQWKKAGLEKQMAHSTARLLIAAILDNTLNLTSSNTTREDIDAFNELCAHANVDEGWCAGYFSEVQKNVEADLKNALFNDLKNVRDNPVLPPLVAQLCIWDAGSIWEKLSQIRQWFAEFSDSWMINVIDLKNGCSWFVCDYAVYQKKIESVFQIQFDSGIAQLPKSYLRKEIIKKTKSI